MLKKWITAIVIVLAAALGVTIFLSWKQEENYVVKIGNKEVYSPEYYVYLFEQKSRFESRGGKDIWETDFNGEATETVAKQNALQSLNLVKVTSLQAAPSDLDFTENDQEQINVSAKNLYNSIGPDIAQKLGLTNEALVMIMKENWLFNKQFARITENYVVSESDFSQYFNAYLASHQNIIEDSEADLETIRQREKDKYVQEMKQNIFNNEFKKWSEAAPIQVNEEIYRQISVFDLEIDQKGASQNMDFETLPFWTFMHKRVSYF